MIDQEKGHSISVCPLRRKNETCTKSVSAFRKKIGVSTIITDLKTTTFPFLKNTNKLSSKRITENGMI